MLTADPVTPGLFTGFILRSFYNTAIGLISEPSLNKQSARLSGPVDAKTYGTRRY